jgi:serine/threonine protein phosphatase PrpC
MALRWQAFAVSKRGNSADEYADAFAGNPRKGRFAIADGASESSFASLWAKLLVNEFAHPSSKRASRKDWLRPLRETWSAEVDGLDLPWYAEAKRELGAAATFLGLTLKKSEKPGTGTWMASAVGDCCCFQIRKERLARAFPILDSRDFGNQPRLVTSKRDGKQFEDDEEVDRGTWRAGDRFLLMTDAIAQWLLSAHEQGEQPWQDIASVLEHPQPHEAFSSWIDKLREEDKIRNDDVTLVIIDL